MAGAGRCLFAGSSPEVRFRYFPTRERTKLRTSAEKVPGARRKTITKSFSCKNKSFIYTAKSFIYTAKTFSYRIAPAALNFLTAQYISRINLPGIFVVFCCEFLRYYGVSFCDGLEKVVERIVQLIGL